jgi:TrmH family RNA methyltransferase
MQITAITSDANPLLKKIRGLHQRSIRDKQGLFILEGPKLLGEAFAKGIDIKDVVVSKTYLNAGLPASLQSDMHAITVVDDKIFKDLVTTETPSGIIAIAAKQNYNLDDLLAGPRLAAQPLVVVGEAIQDPGNLGTIMRAALAFGATGLILTKGSVDPFNPKVVRGAMGALFSLPFVFDIEAPLAISFLKQRGLNVMAFTPLAKEPFWQSDLTRPTALVLGNEGQGLTQSTIESADSVVSIPMSDESESLNVAMCAAVVLFDCSRQRMSALR